MFRGLLLKVGRAHFRAASDTSYLACKGDDAFALGDLRIGISAWLITSLPEQAARDEVPM
jgi:hypothetical protein